MDKFPRVVEKQGTGGALLLKEWKSKFTFPYLLFSFLAFCYEDALKIAIDYSVVIIKNDKSS